MTSNYTLYGAQVSLFTGKARSYLLYKGVPFTEIKATRNVFSTVIVPKTGVKFIPVVRIDDTDEYIQDTTVIIDAIEKRESAQPVMPTTPKQLLVSKLFELYADEWLLIPAMHYRWNKGQEEFVHGEFGDIVLPNWPGFVRRWMGAKLGSRFQGFVPKLGITEATIPAIEDWYERDFLPALDVHFSQNKYLLGNDAASIGDFGLMGPLYAHLYRDPKSGKLLKRTAPHVAAWVERMNTTPTTVLGTSLPNDQVPDTLVPILKRMFAEFVPVLRDTVKRMEEWKLANPNAPIPRVIGNHSFHIGSATGERVVSSFSQWKLQRVLDVYQGFDAGETQQVDEWLSKTVGVGSRALVIPIQERVKRENNRLVWETSSHKSPQARL